MIAQDHDIVRPEGSGIADHVRALTAAIRAAAANGGRPPGAAGAATFITISRQAGAGGRTLAHQLATALAAADPKGSPWTVWDHELVEKVSAEQAVPEPLVEALEDGRRPWFLEFLASLASPAAAQPEEFAVYRRVSIAIRSLARAGRAIIVGRGGVFVTGGLPGGVHVRLVAPLEDRVAQMARRRGIDPAEAAAIVRQIDRNRRAFYRRYWPNADLSPESFTLTLNTAALTDRQMVDCLLPVASAAAAPAADSPECRDREQPR